MHESIDYICKSCNKDAGLVFWIESHDEFGLDSENCENCGVKIPQSVLDKIYNDEPIDYISSKIDYATDMMKDR